MDSESNSQIEIKGTFLGKPIDLTIRECPVPETTDSEPAPEQEAEKPAVDPTVDQPAEPKNPAGNAEQL